MHPKANPVLFQFFIGNDWLGKYSSMNNLKEQAETRRASA
jgi:hypothetical protein